MGTHPIFESDFDSPTDFSRMAKSLRSKRMRRNRALKAEKTQPRVLKRMVEAFEKAKVFNAQRQAEKERQEGVEMEDVAEPEIDTAKDTEMEDSNKPTFSEKTGIMTDGSKPVWMNDKKFKKLKRKATAKKDKFGLVTHGLGPRRK